MPPKIKSKLSKTAQRLFNDDRKLYSHVKPSEKEIENLEKFEYKVLVDNGLKNISGGYSKIIICAGNKDAILLYCEYGFNEDGAGSKQYWRVKYNRKTEKFEKVV